MTRDDRLREIDAELLESEQGLALIFAKVQGLRAERAALLRPAAGDVAGPRGLPEAAPLTDAARREAQATHPDGNLGVADMIGLQRDRELVAALAVRKSEREPLSEMLLTDAIVEIVSDQAPRLLKIDEVCKMLSVAGVDFKESSVASTMAYLTNVGRLRRPSRGRYTIGTVDGRDH